MSDEPAQRSSCRILLISGSMRAGSTNAAVLKAAQQLAPEGCTAEIYNGLDRLPAFNPDDDSQSRPLPQPVANLRAQLAAADAVLFSTPEYAGSLPGAFKNLLDWTVGGGMYEMPAGYINASSQRAATGAHEQLRTVLGYISAQLVADACVQVPVRHDAVSSDGTLSDPEIRRSIQAAVAALVQHALKHPRAPR